MRLSTASATNIILGRKGEKNQDSLLQAVPTGLVGKLSVSKTNVEVQQKITSSHIQINFLNNFVAEGVLKRLVGMAYNSESCGEKITSCYSFHFEKLATIECLEAKHQYSIPSSHILSVSLSGATILGSATKFLMPQGL